MTVYAKLLLTTLFWGGAFVAGKHVAGHLDPFSVAFLRFAMAALLLLGLIWKKEHRLPRLDHTQTLAVLLLGATGIFAYNAMFFKGLSLIEASRASLIIATCPAFIALASAMVLRERLGGARMTGVLLSVLGAALVISRGNLRGIFAGRIGAGEWLILGCVLCWVAYSLLGKVVMRTLSPLVTVFYAVVAGTAALFIAACLEGLGANLSRASIGDWLAITYMAVFATVIGFVWFYEGVRQIGATRAGLFINFVPVFAVLLAFLMLDEALTASLGVGAIFVLFGVYLTNRGALPPNVFDKRA
jgi:drug/metabolite transporter (DMT)-like permease